MNRREEEFKVEGHVMFPIGETGWTNTRDDGMFVRLVVLAEAEDEACSGALVEHLYHQAELLGDDTGRSPGEVEQECFPKINVADDEKGGDGYLDRFLSVPCLAVVELGSTNWSGWNNDLGGPLGIGGYFRCEKQHLTFEGSAIYSALKFAFHRHRVLIQTWLCA